MIRQYIPFALLMIVGPMSIMIRFLRDAAVVQFSILFGVLFCAFPAPLIGTTGPVSIGASAPAEFALTTESVATIEMAAFSVTTEVAASSGIGLLASRQKAVGISDAIGRDDFDRFALDDAADATTQVTGASLVDGKYVMIRGLGDRYSNTLLNGVSMPTADPEKRAVQMDQFPAELLESIVTTKTFTPDQPASFSGGSVNLKTKSFPEQFFLSVSASLGYTADTTGKKMLTIPGQSGDSFGLGARQRDAPVLAASLPGRTAASIAARGGDFGPSEQLDAASKAFDNRGYFPSLKRAGPDSGFAIAFGGTRTDNESGRAFGYTVSVTFDRDFEHIVDGQRNRFEGIVSAPQVQLSLSPNPSSFTFPTTTQPSGTPALGVTSSTESVSWGTFAKLAFRAAKDHEISLDFFHNQSAEATVLRGVGEQQRDYPGNFYEVYDLNYTQRAVSSVQVAGKSLFASIADLALDYRLAYSESSQDQPDYRTLASYYDPSGAAVNATGVQPNRFFRALSEDSLEFNVDATLPFDFKGREGRFKAGASYISGDRDYSEQRFQWSNRPQSRTDLESFPGSVGITTRTPNSVIFGNTITRLQEPNNYMATQTFSSAYAMADLPLTKRLRAIFGARMEKTDMHTTPVRLPGLNTRDGVVLETDTLASLSLVFASTPKVNWRAAYGRTLARPTLKELTDIRYEDVFTLDTYLGNPQIGRTLIDNFDLRLEWFPRRGETIAASAFYKKMSDPIEVVFTPATGAIQPQNVDQGTVFGVEFEFNRTLDFLSDALSGFSFGANLALIASEVSIPETEMQSIRLQEPNARNKRELLGQSPYVFNTNLSYNHRSSGTVATVSYNVVGERLSLVQFGSLPDVYEQPAGSLNLVVSQRLSNRLRLKFSAKNLLDPKHEKLVGFETYDLVYESYRTGPRFAVSLSWLFE